MTRAPDSCTGFVRHRRTPRAISTCHRILPSSNPPSNIASTISDFLGSNPADVASTMARFLVPIASLLLSVAVLLIGHGLQLTLLPLRGEVLGWSAAEIGLT